MNKATKVLFIGTTDFAAKILEAINTFDNTEIIGVVCQPDKKIGRKQELHVPEPKKVAIINQWPYYQPNKISSIISELELIKIDITVVCDYGQILPQSLIDLASITTLNIHPSLLPKWRGATPIRAALWANDAITGVSLMKMIFRMDAGPIYSQADLTIDVNDNYESLKSRLLNLSIQLLEKSWNKIINKKIIPEPQIDANATYTKKISAESELINWDHSAKMIFNQIRALSPVPGAYSITNNKLRIKILAGEVLNDNLAKTQPPGKIIGWNDKGFIVQANPGQLLITKIHIAGKKPQILTKINRQLPSNLKMMINFN